MKIVNRATFLTMPNCTVFQKYEPCIFDELSILYGAINDGEDFVYESLNTPGFAESTGSGDYHDLLFAMEADGSEHALEFEGSMRDGLFDANQLFAVWSADDVRALIDKLQLALGGAK